MPDTDASVLPREEPAPSGPALPAGYGLVWAVDLRRLRLSGRLPRGRASREARPHCHGYCAAIFHRNNIFKQSTGAVGENSPKVPIFCQLFLPLHPPAARNFGGGRRRSRPPVTQKQAAVPLGPPPGFLSGAVSAAPAHFYKSFPRYSLGYRPAARAPSFSWDQSSLG